MATMADEPKNHWDELARQLGLEAQPQPEAHLASREKAQPIPSEPVTNAPEPMAEAEEPTPEFEDETKLEYRDPFDSLEESQDDEMSEDLDFPDFPIPDTKTETQAAVPGPTRQPRRPPRSRPSPD